MTKIAEYPNSELQFAEGGSPITPSSGRVKLYAKPDGAMYSMDDTGTETPLGGGGIPDAPSDGTTYGRKDAAWVPTLGSGDFSGPASSVDGNLVVFDGTTGKLGKDGGTPASRTPNIQTVTSASTVTPTFSNDIVTITAQATALTLANPSGTPIPGLGLVVRVKDNGTARAISYGTQYRAIGVTLPTTTVVSKTLYLAMIYNATDTTWDVVAVGQQA